MRSEIAWDLRRQSTPKDNKKTLRDDRKPFPPFSPPPWGNNSTKYLWPGTQASWAQSCPWQSLGGNQVFALAPQPVLNGTNQQTVTLPLAVSVLVRKWSRLIIQLVTPKHSFPSCTCMCTLLFCLYVGIGENKAEPFTFAEECLAGTCLSVRRKLYTGLLQYKAPESPREVDVLSGPGSSLSPSCLGEPFHFFVDKRSIMIPTVLCHWVSPA